MRKLATVVASLFGLLVSSSAHAHISLERAGTHKSRYGDAMIKEGPCGMPGGTRGSNVYTYEPGQTITVDFVEFIPHPGYFRFAFDDDGDDDFVSPKSIDPVDPARGCPAQGLTAEMGGRDQCAGADLYNSPSVLPEMDDLEPHVMVEFNKAYSFQVKLPDVECDNCTLQIIQVMEDQIHGPYNLEVSGQGDAPDVYYQCIDLVLKKGAGSGAAGAHAPAAGGGAHDHPAAGSGGQPATVLSKEDGGCSVRTGRSASSLFTLFCLAGAFVFAWHRRRRRAGSLH